MRTRPLGNSDNCFLCKPDERLLVSTGNSMVLMAGLGPIVENYCLVGSISHINSLADVLAVNTSAIQELIDYRISVQKRLGPVIMTEHGRVPICRKSRTQQHCFHAHALLFPSSVSILSGMATYYRFSQVFNNFIDALAFAQTTDNYLLISEALDHFVVFTNQLAAPRQLARMLIAHAVGDIHLADWEAYPNWEAALMYAGHLRSLWNGAYDGRNQSS